MKKVFHSIVVVFVIMTLLLGAMAALPPKPVQAMSGSGTPEDPYIIMDAVDLQNVTNDLDAYYELGAGINCSGINFVPIGNGAPFTGHFDGNGLGIYDLTIDRPSEDYVGLFGIIGNGATVKDIEISVSISGANYVGGLAGSMDNGRIIASKVYTSLTVSGSYIGGIVGNVDNGVIENSYSVLNLAGSGDNVGGLVGNITGNIDSCSSSVHMIGTNYVGGLAGNITGNIVNSVCDSMVPDTVKGTGDYIGGLAGNINGDIIDCDFTGPVESSGNYVGGLAGYIVGNITNCTSYGEISGASYVGGLVGNSDNGTIQTSDVNGTVTGSGDYIGGLVGNANVNINYCNSDGHFSGSNYVGGLAGNINGDITNSAATTTIVRSVVGTGNYVGGLVGNITGNITTSHSDGPVTGGGDYVGGLVGNISGTITNCFSISEISGANSVGGLVGNITGDINTSYSASHVTATGDSVGGLVGIINGDASTSFWDIDVAGILTSSGGTSKTTSEMKTQSTFTDAGWDFISIWDIYEMENAGYPFLRSEVVEIPIVGNLGASDITLNSARLNGELSYTGIENPTVHIYWGDNNGGTDPTSWDNDVDLGNLGLGTFHIDITGLTRDTTYCYRCFAQNSAGFSWANQTTYFKTKTITLPAVTNPGASYVTITSARLNGEVTDTGDENPIIRIYWGDNDGGTDTANWDYDINLGTLGLGTFYTDIAGLTPNTTYYYRCFARNSAGASWAASTSSFVASTKLVGADDVTPQGYLNYNLFSLTKYTAVYPGTMTQIKIKCYRSGNVKVAIYDGNNLGPSHLLSANNTSTPVSEGWNTIDVSPVQITLGTIYWLAFISDTSCVGITNSGGPSFHRISSYSSFSFPTSAGGGFSWLSNYSHLIAGCGIPSHSYSTTTEQTYTQTNLSETLLEQTLVINNIAVTGDLSGTFAFTDFKTVSIETGPFANNGFFEAEWQANLEGADYAGNWKGMLFLNQEENRIRLKGTSSGGISGIIDGYLRESVAGSGIYDQFQADLQFSEAVTTAASGTIYLNGSAVYQASQEYPSTQLYVLQTSLAGTSAGDYTGALDIVLTHLRVLDENSPYYGHGFSTMSYTSEIGSGVGYTYDRLGSGDNLELSGIFSGPLLGIISGVLNASKSPRSLSIAIERIDLGAPPNADLVVRVWSQERVSPGQTVTYSIEYRNDGLKAATDVIILDKLSPLAKYKSASAGAHYNPYSHQVSWDLGPLPPKSIGYLTVTTEVIWRLPLGTNLVNSANFIDMALGSRQTSGYQNGFVNGIGLDLEDIGQWAEYTLFCMLADAAWYQAFEKTDTVLSGAIDAFLASKDVSTEANLVGADSPVNYDRLMWIGYSGGTIVVVNQASNHDLKGQTLYLISPQIITQANIEKAMSHGKFPQAVVLQGDDMISQGVALFAYFFTNSETGDTLTHKLLVAGREYDQKFDKLITQLETKENKGELQTIRFLPREGNLIVLLFKDGFDSFTITPDIDPGSGIEVIDVIGIQHGDWIPVLICFLEKFKRLPLTVADTPELQKCVDEHYGNLARLTQTIAPARDPNSLSVSPEGYIKPGDTLTYTIDYENEGEGNAYGVYITDTLQQNLDASTLSINNGGMYDPQTRTIKWFIGEVQSKQKGSVSFNVNAKANAPDGTEILNFATVYFPSVPEETRTNGVVSVVMLHPQQIVVDTISIPMTSEEGDRYTFTVSLTYYPISDVTINLSSDNPSEGIISPTSLIFTPNDWSLTQSVTVTGVSDNIVDGNVTYHIITAPAISSDPGYNGLDPEDVTVVNVDLTPADSLPPITQIQVTPPANENGWNNSNLTIDLTATDNEGGSGIKEIHYKLSGATEVEQTIPADAVSFTIYSEGITDLTCYAIDNAGNQEAEKSLTLKLDKTTPTITTTPSPQPNSNGWNNSAVTVSFGATDELSGIKSVTDPITVSTEGASQNITGEAIDFAGNKASTSAIVSVDKTPPTITATTSPQPNSNGWNNTDVTVTFSAADDLSGVESISEPFTFTDEGANQEFTGQATDLAGNTATLSSTVSVDKTSPIIAASASPQPNANGWNNTNVTVIFSASDNLSGIKSVTGPITISAEGANQNITGEAVDLAGNTATTSIEVNIDKTLPIVSITANPSTLWPPNHKMVNVTIGGSATDDLAGIASTTFTVTDEYGTTQPVISGFNTTIKLEASRDGNDKDGRTYTISVTTRDKAGNAATSSTKVICPHDQGK